MFCHFFDRKLKTMDAGFDVIGKIGADGNPMVHTYNEDVIADSFSGVHSAYICT